MRALIDSAGPVDLRCQTAFRMPSVCSLTVPATALIGFGEAIRELCEPSYEPDRLKGGRPGTDPEVYFKMLMIGMFKNIPSGRAIAAQCADSIGKRSFLRYELTERTPDHRTLSFITKRLPASVFRAAFDLMLDALRTVGLAAGKDIAIDSSDIEANASMKSIVRRTSKEDYMSYVRRLAEEAGVVAGCEQVRTFAAGAARRS